MSEPTADDRTEPIETLFERVGGQPFFDELVARFYDGVVVDPVLRPMYPDDDLTGAQRRLALFLAQYWGGPTTYSEERGHPRLRMRHAPFPVDAAARQAWLEHMTAAVLASGAEPDDQVSLLGYFRMAADHLQNRPG